MKFVGGCLEQALYFRAKGIKRLLPNFYCKIVPRAIKGKRKFAMDCKEWGHQKLFKTDAQFFQGL